MTLLGKRRSGDDSMGKVNKRVKKNDKVYVVPENNGMFFPQFKAETSKCSNKRQEKMETKLITNPFWTP